MKSKANPFGSGSAGLGFGADDAWSERVYSNLGFREVSPDGAAGSIGPPDTGRVLIST